MAPIDPTASPATTAPTAAPVAAPTVAKPTATTFAQRLEAARGKLGEGERLERVGDHAYGKITGGKRDDSYVNLSGNARDGQVFEKLHRNGRTFHIYGAGSERIVVGLRSAGAKTPAATTPATTPAATTGTQQPSAASGGAAAPTAAPAPTASTNGAAASASSPTSAGGSQSRIPATGGTGVPDISSITPNATSVTGTI